MQSSWLIGLWTLHVVLPPPWSHRRMTIRILEFIYRFRFTWIISSILAVVTVLLLLIVLPRKYFSEAKLIVRVGRESVGLDPTVTTSQTLMLQKSQEEEINSALAVLSSRKIKELVVESLGVETILGGHLPGGEHKKRHGFRSN